MSRIALNKEQATLISSAVQRAEKKTSGEIATALIKESDNYGFYEALFALGSGFIYFIIASVYIEYIEDMLKSFFWDYSSVHLAGFLGISIFAVITIFYLISNIPAVDRLIIPGKVMKQKVYHRSLRHFVESGVSNTRDRTGILIFISELERRVELIADRGISSKIQQSQWNSIVEGIVAGVKENRFPEALAKAIDTCGELLAKNFPIKEDDSNELKDEITLLEK